MPRPVFRYLLTSLVLLSLLTCSACVSRATSELKDALSVAVKRDKLSPEEMQNILKEYELLRDENRKKAGEYVEEIVTAIEMGADSSHIDVVRRRFVKAQRGDVRV